MSISTKLAKRVESNERKVMRPQGRSQKETVGLVCSFRSPRHKQSPAPPTKKLDLMQEIYGSESLPQRYFCLAAAKAVVPEAVLLVHDDSCHMYKLLEEEGGRLGIY